MVMREYCFGNLGAARSCVAATVGVVRQSPLFERRPVERLRDQS